MRKYLSALLFLGITFPLIIVTVYVAKKQITRAEQTVSQPETTQESLPQPNQDERLSKLETKVDTALKRLGLLGAITNQNIYVITQKLPANDVIYINGDWTIDSMPKHTTNTTSLQPFIKQ